MLIQARCSGIGDLWGDRAGFFVYTILQGRLGVLPVKRAQQLRAEVGGDGDGGVGIAAFERSLCSFCVEELPAQLMVLAELFCYLFSYVDTARDLRKSALVLIDNGDLDVFGCSVRVPKSCNVHPRVEGRCDDHADEDDPCLFSATETGNVSSKNLPSVTH